MKTAAAALRADGWLLALLLLPIGSGRMVVCAVFTGFVLYWGAAYTSSVTSRLGTSRRRSKTPRASCSRFTNGILRA